MAHPYTAKFVEFCRNNVHIERTTSIYQSLPICIIDCVYSLRTKYKSVTVPIVHRYADSYLKGDVIGTEDNLSLFLERMNHCGF